jgi:hypothetical protein
MKTFSETLLGYIERSAQAIYKAGPDCKWAGKSRHEIKMILQRRARNRMATKSRKINREG